MAAYSFADDDKAAANYVKESSNSRTDAGLYTLAVEKLHQEKYREARALLQELNRRDPHSASAFGTLGYCQLWIGHSQEGAESLGKAIAIDSKNPLYYYRRGLCFFSTMQIPEAIDTLTRGLAIKPEDNEELRLRARCYRTLADPRAVEDYTHLINNKAYIAESLCERANYYWHHEAIDKALADLDAALDAQPGYGEAYLMRGNIFYQLHQWRAAADNFSAALGYGTDKPAYCQMQRELSLGHLGLRSNGTAPPKKGQIK